MASADTDAASDSNKVTIKFLVSNVFAGTLIGAKGAAIKELMDVTGARVTVSGNKEFYPGTSDRVLVISGSHESVLLTNALIWELMYILATNKSSRTSTWSPATSRDFLNASDDVELKAKLTIPAAAGGLILGRSGATLKQITDSCGATVQMSTKEEAVFTQERILTISGSAIEGKICTELIIKKLLEDEEASTYANRGTRYSAEASGVAGARNMRRDNRIAVETERIPAETTITMTVPDNLIGNIIGRGGSTLREITSLSGAKIVVSSREELVDGNRVVTITGEPSAAQTAHAFCAEKMRQSKIAPRPRGRREDDSSAN